MISLSTKRKLDAAARSVLRNPATSKKAKVKAGLALTQKLRGAP